MLALLIRSGYYPYVVGALVAVAFGYWHGAADASLQREFLVSKADRCVVVLREYGDKAIAARRVGVRLIDPQTVIVLRLGDEVLRVRTPQRRPAAIGASERGL